MLNEDFAIALYFVDDETFKEAEQYLKTHSKCDSSFDKIVKQYKDIGFGYKDGIINISYEEYESLRMETKNE